MYFTATAMPSNSDAKLIQNPSAVHLKLRRIATAHRGS